MAGPKKAPPSLSERDAGADRLKTSGPVRFAMNASVDLSLIPLALLDHIDIRWRTALPPFTLS
jgi:hypothetical protein